MLPMFGLLKKAPENYQATYFAAMAAFTSLAFMAGHLGTRLLKHFTGKIQVFTFMRKGL
jgi:hypothetical protein